MSVRSYLIAAMTWYSGFFQLFLVTRFACDIGQLARIWIWVSSEVITVYEYQSTSWIFHSLLYRAEETQQGRNGCPAGSHSWLPVSGLYHVIAPLSFLRSISLASLFAILSNFWLIRSCIPPSHTNVCKFFNRFNLHFLSYYTWNAETLQFY